MGKKYWLFIIGVVVGALAIILLCSAAVMGGLVTKILLERQSFTSGTITKTIDARLGWQATGVKVKPGTKLSFTVIKGEWTHWLGTQPFNSGEGGGYICAKAMKASGCVEPLPEFPAGGLIGKIGSQPFGIGKGGSIVAGQSGSLLLRVNDADIGLYDNDGVLVVEIIVEK